MSARGWGIALDQVAGVLHTVRDSLDPEVMVGDLQVRKLKAEDWRSLSHNPAQFINDYHGGGPKDKFNTHDILVGGGDH